MPERGVVQEPMAQLQYRCEIACQIRPISIQQRAIDEQSTNGPPKVFVMKTLQLSFFEKATMPQIGKFFIQIWKV
jgi:hypothetical protein